MNLKVCALFCVFVLNQLGYSQANWFRELKIPNIVNGMVTKIIPLPNNELLILGGGTDTLNQQNRVKLIVAKTTDQLQLLSYKTYDSPKHTYTYSFAEGGTILINNQIYLLGILLSTSNQNISTIVKLNSNGDTLWQKFYSATGNRDAVFRSICYTKDNHLAITGFSQDWTNHTQECLLLKLDTLGNEVWRKYIVNNQAKKVVAGFKIIQNTTSGRFYMIGYKYLGTNSQFTSAGSLIITDSLGGVIRQVTLNNEDGGPFYDMIQTKDSNFVACGGWNTFNDLGGYPRTKSMLVKFDQNGDTIWTSKNDNPAIFNYLTNLIEYPNKNILSLGMLDTMQNLNLDPIIRIRMICHSESGKVLWKRNSRYSYNKNYSMGPNCISKYGLNGLLIGTSNYLSNSQRFNVLKIDTLGCDTVPGFCDYEDLTVGIKEHVSNNVSITIYPNPSQGSFTIHASENYSGATYLLIDVFGRIVHSGTVINTSQTVEVTNLPSGVFTLRLVNRYMDVFACKVIIQK